MPNPTPPPPPPPPPQVPSLPVPVASAVLSSFTSFLTLTLHSLLYHRALYPSTTFLTSRALNLPVHQSRHPGLCGWINDAVTAIALQLQDGAVRRIAVVMHAPDKKLSVVERWVIDVGDFPRWGNVLFDEDDDDEDGEEGKEEQQEQKKDEEGEEGEDEEDDEDDSEVEEDEDEDEVVNWTDINEALRGALRRIAYTAESKPPLPAGSTFTLALELRDDAPAPIRHPQPWIPSQPSLQSRRRSRRSRGRNRSGAPPVGGTSTTPIRSVQAGPLFFECWLEQRQPPPSS